MIILLVMACGLNVQIVCCAMWHVHVGSVECSPGVCCILWGLRALLDLLGPYCVYRIIYMSSLMSSWDVNPTIRYILCVFAHIVVAMCVLFSRWNFSCPARQDCMALICYFIFIPSDSWPYTENQPC